MQRDWEIDMKNAKEYVRKLQIILLNNNNKEEPTEEKENPIEKYTSNQKLGVCEALLNIGDWENALLIIKRLPEHFALDHEPVGLALCRLLQYIVEPVYRA